MSQKVPLSKKFAPAHKKPSPVRKSKKPVVTLQVGDLALTDFNELGKFVQVEITARDDNPRGACQSGVLFQVKPALRNGTLDSWYDAGWFQPI